MCPWRGYGEASIDVAAAAISRFEAYIRYRDFKRFNVEQARAFKRQLTEKTKAIHSGAALSKATISSTLRALQAFFRWLGGGASMPRSPYVRSWKPTNWRSTKRSAG